MFIALVSSPEVNNSDFYSGHINSCAEPSHLKYIIVILIR
jgi:hypothetical protein